MKGLQAGLDQDGGGTAAIKLIPGLVKSGQISSERVALSFRRLMRQRIRLGMLDPPASVEYNKLRFDTVLESANHTQIARVAAQKSICLYQNRAPQAARQDVQEGSTARAERAFWLPSINVNHTLPLNLKALATTPGSVLLTGWMAGDSCI